MTTQNLQMPPEDAWIERREEFITDVQESRSAGISPGKQARRITGNLRGAWPDHGRVRYIRGENGSIAITEVSIVLHPDGSAHSDT